jgi:hypothetical protein
MFDKKFQFWLTYHIINHLPVQRSSERQTGSVQNEAVGGVEECSVFCCYVLYLQLLCFGEAVSQSESYFLWWLFACDEMSQSESYFLWWVFAHDAMIQTESYFLWWMFAIVYSGMCWLALLLFFFMINIQDGKCEWY